MTHFDASQPGAIDEDELLRQVLDIGGNRLHAGAQDTEELTVRQLVYLPSVYVPLVDDGTDVCLSYHLQGGYWSNCKRAVNHSHHLSAAETQRVEQYMTQRFAAMTPAPTQGSGASAPAGSG
jgi:hypothetical protein